MKKFLILILIFSMPGCGGRMPPPEYQKHSEARMLMGTIIKIDVCYETGEDNGLGSVLGLVWDRLEDIHWRMSIYDDTSEVSEINRSYQNPVQVGPDTYFVLERAAYFAELTSGAFDITAGPLIELWKSRAQANVLPAPEEIENTRSVVGFNYVELMDGNFVQLLNKNTRIDLGGIAKGYGVDESAAILRNHGFNNFLIDAGGDLFAGGNNCEGDPWRIGIRSPVDASEFADIIAISNAAVTTSGNYEQFYEIQGKKWSHIINPITGYPQGSIVSATVIAPSAQDADALSTSLCVLGAEDGVSLIDSLGSPFASMVVVEGEGSQPHKIESGHYALLKN